MKTIETTKITVGVVGLGLMGSSLIASLLMAGHAVKAIAPLKEDMEAAPERIHDHLLFCARAGLLQKPVEAYLQQLVISEDYKHLSGCHLVLECVIEISDVKRSVYEKIEAIVRPDTVIATNTSAIPISELQNYLQFPERFLGVHWAEPSYFTRFMEITCGSRTAVHHAEWIYELAHAWEKEPTLLRKDIRGFVTNRLMYAVYREGLHLVTSGKASFEDVDKSFRYDVGSWITLMGIFRRMDYMGLKDYFEGFKRIFPQFCNEETISPLMQKMIDIDAKGIRNGLGLYRYTAEEARRWDEAFTLFNVDIYQLAVSYPPHREKARTLSEQDFAQAALAK